MYVYLCSTAHHGRLAEAAPRQKAVDVCDLAAVNTILSAETRAITIPICWANGMIQYILHRTGEVHGFHLLGRTTDGADVDERDQGRDRRCEP